LQDIGQEGHVDDHHGPNGWIGNAFGNVVPSECGIVLMNGLNGGGQLDKPGRPDTVVAVAVVAVVDTGRRSGLETASPGYRGGAGK
jgi:hypothetical protein